MSGAVIERRRQGSNGRHPVDGLRRPAPLALMMSASLVAAIVIVATSMSVGFARAQTLNAISEPDTGLVLAMLAGAIGLMGALSALAVRLAGRPRQR